MARVSDENKELLSSFRTLYNAGVRLWQFLQALRFLLIGVVMTAHTGLFNVYRIAFPFFQEAETQQNIVTTTGVWALFDSNAALMIPILGWALAFAASFVERMIDRMITACVLRNRALEHTLGMPDGIFMHFGVGVHPRHIHWHFTMPRIMRTAHMVLAIGWIFLGIRVFAVT